MQSNIQITKTLYICQVFQSIAFKGKDTYTRALPPGSGETCGRQSGSLKTCIRAATRARTPSTISNGEIPAQRVAPKTILSVTNGDNIPEETAMTNGMYRVFTSKDMVITDNSQRVISGKLNNPVRKYFISIDATPWNNIKVSVPEQYKELVGAVLDKTARDILLDAVRNSTAVPGELPNAWFTEENLLDRATNGASDWLAKEELEEAWKASDTRKRIIETDNYKNNPAYRKTANAFAEMVLKLSGKTTFLEEKYQDWILSKLSESDLDTEFGVFVTMRISRMKGKEKKQEFDLDIL